MITIYYFLLVVDECYLSGKICGANEVCQQDPISKSYNCVCEKGYSLVKGVCTG